jgi:hypothetical protein
MANKATIHDALEADALEIALMKWRIGVCADTDTSPEVLAQIKQRGGIKPSDARRAADLFDIARMESWWQIYVALKCAAITDGESALNVYDDALALGWGTSRLKEAIAETKPQRAKRKADADKCERCAEVKKIISAWDDPQCVKAYSAIDLRDAINVVMMDGGDA